MVHPATKLLADFRALPSRKERPRTFLEIASYPHYENACSNILAFFMDPEESHGLGTLVLDALMFTGDNTEAEKGIGGNVSVEREVITSKGRIDLLVTSDDHAIVIENKIHAGVSNPFSDYADHLGHIADGRSKRKFLLTLYPTSEGSEWGFTNLTHEEFVRQIRSRLGLYVSDVDARYLIVFLDFLNTLESLQKGSRMDKGFVRLLSERTNDVSSFLAGVFGFKDELRKKVRDLGNIIVLGRHQDVRQFFWREQDELYDTLVHDIRVHEELLVALEIYISAEGWGIYIWPRRGDRSELLDLLQRSMVTFDDEGEEGVSHPAYFDYDEDLDRISPVLQEIIDKLATGREA
ncbi:MAG: PD-(D/E)XK nuclease family protein [Rubrobacter sp.]